MTLYLTEDNTEIDNRDSSETWLHHTDEVTGDVTTISVTTTLVVRTFESIIDNLPPGDE